MNAKIRITQKINDLFASYEAELISDETIKVVCPGEGKASLSKTVTKGEIVLIDSEPISKFELINGKTYDISYVASLYAKNNVQPIILTATSIK